VNVSCIFETDYFMSMVGFGRGTDQGTKQARGFERALLENITTTGFCSVGIQQMVGLLWLWELTAWGN
jgi:hypothetical protein